MPVAFLQTHILVVIVFLLLFGIKALLLFMNLHKTLHAFQKQTRILDIIFGVLILVTGGFLVFDYNGPLPTWLWVKAGLVLAGIPLSIIGLKRHNKVLTVLGAILFLYVYGVTETQSLSFQPDYEMDPTEAYIGEDTAITAAAGPQPAAPSAAGPAADGAAVAELNKGVPPVAAVDQIEEDILGTLEESALANAQSIFSQQCVSCHGQDGGKLIGDGANLRKSSLTLPQQKAVIAKGRGLMPAYEGTLSEQEMEALAAYTLTLKP